MIEKLTNAVSWRDNSAVGRIASRKRRISLVMTVAIMPVLVAVMFSAPGKAFSADSDVAFRERYGLPDDPEPLLYEILSRKEFNLSEEPSFWELVVRRIVELLGRIWRWLTRGLPSPGPVSLNQDALWWAAAIVLMACLVAAAVVLVRFLANFLSRDKFRRPRRDAPSADQALPITGSENAWKQALALAQNGNYGEALVYLFRFLLLLLDERGKLTFVSFKTSREIVAGLERRDPIRPMLMELIPLFNGIRYGNAACSRSDYEKFLGLCNRVTGSI